MPSFEDELGQALRRTGDGFSTDQQRLADTGRAKGLRTLRRRRAGAVTGSVAALALVGVGGAWAGGLLGGSGGGTGEVAAPATTSPGKDKGDITPAWMIATFKGLLPPGEMTEVSAGGVGGVEDSENPFVYTDFDDKAGKAAVMLNLGRVDPRSSEARKYVTCPSKVTVRFDMCGTEKLADGSDLMVLQGYAPKTETKMWWARLVTTEGLVVRASEYNGPGPSMKGGPVSRPNPPLDLARLKALVTDAQWRTATDALPVEKPTDYHKPSEPTPDEMSATLAALLPKGLERSDKESRPGFAGAVVNDGKGGSLVQVNAQPEGSIAGPSTELPDGTKVAVTESGGDEDVPGTVMLTVDTVGPDGRRVVISALNSDTQHSAPTRKRPALTVEQLKAIALSPTWWK
ncbi:hypothetical protein [Streptomyces sp. NPDC058657]|uniref:hypothetical protein n=1 Tax=unclassified Streptomyces TaxID=2593676 RepID=UPI00364C7243